MKKALPAKERFPHRRLNVYKEASLFFVACWKFAERVGCRDFFMRSQFLRSALAIKLNISEGASETRPKEKARFYRIARREAAECAAFLDDLPEIFGIPEAELEPFYERLFHISNMLTQLIKSVDQEAASVRKKRP